jgi:predicted nucleotidyltransferase
MLDPLIPRVVEAVLASEPVRVRQVIACWVFGSRAAGKGRPGSDVDVAILCDPPLGLERTRVMDAVGRVLGVDVDVIDLASAPPTLRWEVITSGKLLVERDEEAVEQFVRQARWEADDEEQRNRMIVLAQVDERLVP